MGQKDLSEKLLVAFDDVFADIVNVLIFGGRCVIRPEELEDRGPGSIYKTNDMLRVMERDVVKRWKKGKVRFACIGVENQTTVDQDMPLRVIGYDGVAYRAQLSDKELGKERYPVITIVLYFGYKKRWDKAVTLLERVTVHEGLDSFVNDYRINLFEIAYLSDEQVAMFQSDFRIVADYFVQKRKNNTYTPSQTEIRHVEAVLQLLTIMERDDRFENAIYKNNGRKVENMCDVLDAVEQRGIERGRKEMQSTLDAVEQRGIERGRKEMQSTLDAVEQRGIEQGRKEMQSTLDAVEQRGIERGRKEMQSTLDAVEQRGIEKGRREVQSTLGAVEQRGIERGVEQGRREIATRLADMGFSVDKISEIVKMNTTIVRIWLDSNMNPIK